MNFVYNFAVIVRGLKKIYGLAKRHIYGRDKLADKKGVDKNYIESFNL